jgi:IS1 family transposase
MFGKRQDQAFLALKALLQPFGIRRYYTDGWGTYQRHVEPEMHEVGKHHTQQLERKHLTQGFKGGLYKSMAYNAILCAAPKFFIK